MKPCKSARRLLCVWLLDGPCAAADRPEQRDAAGERAALKKRAALEKLAVWCEQFSPIVALDESETSDTLLLDITGVAHLFGGEAALAGLMIRRFQHRGLPVRIAVADTIGAAWAVSHFGLGIGDCGLGHPEGTRNCGFCCVPPFSNRGTRQGGSSAVGAPALAGHPQLGSLPVAALRVPPETVRLLSALGIHTIAGLAALPRDQLTARFGPELLLRLDQFTGVCEEALVAVRQPPVAVAEQLLEYPVWRRDAIRQVLQRLIGQICDQLVQRGQGVLRLNCRLDVQAGPVLQIPVGLYQPSANADHLLGLVDLQLERLRIREPVIALQVTATATDRLEVRQLGIADWELGIADWDEERRRLAHLVDRLSSRLGRDAVLVPHLLADAVPECACQLEPMTSLKTGSSSLKQRSSRNSRTARGKAQGTNGQPPAHPFLRPLWLNPQPIALPVTAVIPDGPPIRFRWAGHSYNVAAWWGPERIETGWWRDRAPRRVRRDYYRVETASGQRFWLFRRRDDNQWFLHGEFD